MTKPPLIALTGYGRAGKDILGEALVQTGFRRMAFGDIIKGIFDQQCKDLLGYSAFTEVECEKEHIRPLLVHGGQVFYDFVSRTFFADLDKARAGGAAIVNTRLFRPEEARLWKERGGFIFEVQRLRNQPKEPEEARSLQMLRESGLIDMTYYNIGTLEDWRSDCADIARFWRPR